jgi:HD-like signal output (HDOD) protein
MNRHPQTVRILLTTQAERESVLRSLGQAHQYLSKPCPPALFLETVQRALGLRDLLGNDQLRRLVSQLQSLPSIPNLYLELLNALSHDDPSVDEVARIISRDLGMCTKLLQLVNSAFFGLPQALSNPVEAVMYLGIETVKALVLSLQIFALFERVKVPGFSYEVLWDHCWRAGTMARRVAALARLPPRQADDAFTAGLLHDVGKLILVTGLPSSYRVALDLERQKGLTSSQAELEVFHATHAEVGAYLLGLWGLPTPVVEAVAWHHRPSESGLTGETPLMAVHVGNAFAHECEAEGQLPSGTGLDLDYLRAIGRADWVPEWREQTLRNPTTD